MFFFNSDYYMFSKKSSELLLKMSKFETFKIRQDVFCNNTVYSHYRLTEYG